LSKTNKNVLIESQNKNHIFEFIILVSLKTISTEMENFTNSILLPDNLPTIDKKTFNPLDKKYLIIEFIRIALFFALLIGGFIVFILFSDETIPALVITITSLAVAFLMTYSIGITYLGFSKKGYLVRENDLSFQKGLLIYKVTSVPFNRIQHVEVNQGILGKIFKLSSVKLFTAGGSASDLSIPGLPQEVAHNLKEFLSEKISEHE
jgi:membrane protein YdbS with pleckstrin-like domain